MCFSISEGLTFYLNCIPVTVFMPSDSPLSGLASSPQWPTCTVASSLFPLISTVRRIPQQQTGPPPVGAGTEQRIYGCTFCANIARVAVSALHMRWWEIRVHQGCLAPDCPPLVTLRIKLGDGWHRMQTWGSWLCAKTRMTDHSWQRGFCVLMELSASKWRKLAGWRARRRIRTCAHRYAWVVDFICTQRALAALSQIQTSKNNYF